MLNTMRNSCSDALFYRCETLRRPHTHTQTTQTKTIKVFANRRGLKKIKRLAKSVLYLHVISKAEITVCTILIISCRVELLACGKVLRKHVDGGGGGGGGSSIRASASRRDGELDENDRRAARRTTDRTRPPHSTSPDTLLLFTRLFFAPPQRRWTWLFIPAASLHIQDTPNQPW